MRHKMRIVDIMSAELVVADLKAKTRDSVLEEIVGQIVTVVREVDATSAFRVLIERERIGSTGVGQGIAIPHAKLSSLSRAIACFGRSVGGVDFGSLDGKPAHLFLTLLVPEGSSGIHLKALARASRLLKDADFRKKLVELDSAPALWDAICAKDTSGTF